MFQVCTFLRKMSKDGYSYGAINAARCALSLLLPRQPSGDTVGKDYWVSRACRAAWVINPPRLRYTRNVGKVFKCLKDWESNKRLTLKRLVMKLLILVLLTTGQRGQVALAME